jgi:hypothetical protein
LISEVPPTDDKFYKERARHIREIATWADPFIKKRLMRLASNCDAMATRPRVTVLLNLPEASENDRAVTSEIHYHLVMLRDSIARDATRRSEMLFDPGAPSRFETIRVSRCPRL